MAEVKNLPIKIFEKRKEDEMLTEGSGGPEPKWVKHGPELKEVALEYTSFLSSLETTLNQRISNDNYIPVVLSAEINEDLLAKSHRTEIVKLFDVNNKRNTIGLQEDSLLMVKVEDTKDLKRMTSNFQEFEKFARGISALEKLSPFKPSVDVEKGELVKIKLIDYHDYEINRVVRISFERFCTENNVSIIRTDYTEDLVIYSVAKPSEEMVVTLQSFDGLLSITDMPIYDISFDMMDAEEQDIEFDEPNPNIDYPIIGVLDSGIAKIPPLKAWLTSESHTNFMEDDMDRSHGTFVAGIILHGDRLEGQEITGFQGCKIFDAAIAPKKDLMKKMSEAELIDNIKEAINSINDINIWSLSAGSDMDADPFVFSDFGVALDKLQEENNVIICKSVGNCDNFKRNAPKRRISRSADSVRSLVVGSVAHKKGKHDLSEVNEPSPFTRIGEGPSNLTKPDLVHFGGNAGMNNGSMTATGVNSFSINGRITSNIGTSFSTPRITSILAGLNHKLDEEFDPLLLKALTIHSAKYPDNLNLTEEERLRQMGFGIPSSIDDIIYNSPNEITLILQDTIEKGKFLDIMDFPYPDLIDEDGNYYGEITVTLVTSPLLDHTQGAEYCQSNLDVGFGTYDTKISKEGKTIRNEIRREGSKNLLNGSLYSTRTIKKNTSFRSERLLRNFYQKFQPVKKWAINLEELKETPKQQFLGAPKKWYLKLDGLYRAFAESKYSNLTQDFCLVVTIRDNKERANVYDNVTQKLNQLNFIQKNIQLREEIRIRTGS
ncbi:MAG: S8 family peptidase [Cytophagales bacterium]